MEENNDKRISDLTEATSTDNDDLFVVVDVSDQSMGITGTTKKIKSSNMPSGGGGSGVEVEIPFLIQQNSGNQSSTSYTPLLQPVVFDKSQFGSITSIVFRAELSQVNPVTGETVYVELYDQTGSVSVTGSELSAQLDEAETAIVTSSDIKSVIAAGPNLYCIQVKVSGGGAEGVINNASIIVRCTSGGGTGTNVEIPFLIQQNSGNQSSTSYTPLLQPVVFDKSQFSSIESINFRASLSQVNPVTGETVYVQLYDQTASSSIVGSELSAQLDEAESSIEISADIKSLIAATANLYCIQVKVSGGGAEGVINNASIIVRST